MLSRSGYIFLALVSTFFIFVAFSFSSGKADYQAESGDVIISEIAWSGTAAQSSGEWIELYNNQDRPVNLTGWILYSSSGLTIVLSGQVEHHSFFLLERNSNHTISNIAADQIFVGELANDGETLILQDHENNVIDTANNDGGSWPAGSGAPDFRSMERTQPASADTDEGWSSNTVAGAGLDADGNQIAGTPGEANSSWTASESRVDLAVHISGPGITTAGDQWIPLITVSNESQEVATNVVITCTLPSVFDYVSDDSGLPLVNESNVVLVWQAGEMLPGTRFSFSISFSIDDAVRGTHGSVVQVASEDRDSQESNNRAELSTTVIGPESSLVLIDAAYYDGYEVGEPDEAIRLINLGEARADISGWTLTDGISRAAFPAGAAIEPGEAIWLTKMAIAFKKQFGFSANYEISESDQSVPKLEGLWPGFSNDGDEVLLLNGSDQIIDVLVYENGDSTQPGWSGTPVFPYAVSGVFSAEGQILYRMRDPHTGIQVADTNKAEDWAQWPGSPVNGRKVLYPGWDLERFFFPEIENSNSTLQIAVAPDNAYETLSKQIQSAQESIFIESLTFRSYGIANELTNALQRGVEVIVLLEGSPVGGLEESEKLNCQIIEEAGGQCWFMISDDSLSIKDRYRFLHAKFIIIDGIKVATGSENLSPNSLPDDDKSDGTLGRRGVILITDEPGIVSRFKEIWEVDFDPINHQDLFRWSAGHAKYGAPLSGTRPITETGGSEYSILFPEPEQLDGNFEISLIQSPENSLNPESGLLGLLESSGPGDTILVQQLVEELHWGPTNSNRLDDPNPRLEAILAAARRGAHVRMLLDSFFPSSAGNSITCNTLNGIASDENLDLVCKVANPTGQGIHNKMVLVETNGKGTVHAGSINGTELSNKGNREVALQVQSNQAFDYLSRMFESDWPRAFYFPVAFFEFRGPAGHLLISEVLYDPAGADNKEFIEIVNPTGYEQNLGRLSLGDAVNRSDFEDVRQFPDPTVLLPGQVVVVAAAAISFADAYGFQPDFEIINSDPSVPDLIDDSSWGDTNAILQLGNSGDEVILRDSSDNIIDAIAYGDGLIEGMESCSLVVVTGRSFERYPYWRDSDSCPNDFRNWTLPSPGYLP